MRGDVSKCLRALPTPILFSESLLPDLFQANHGVVLSDNRIAFASDVFKVLAAHDLHCTAGVLDNPLPLQNTGR